MLALLLILYVVIQLVTFPILNQLGILSHAPTTTSSPTTHQPTLLPTISHTDNPTAQPTANPTIKPTAKPTSKPTAKPVPAPTRSPVILPYTLYETQAQYAPFDIGNRSESTAKCQADPGFTTFGCSRTVAFLCYSAGE